MSSLSLLGLCLISLTLAAAALHSNDYLLMVALQGDSVALPCGIPSITSCSSINWNSGGNFASVTEVVKSGRVINHRYGLLRDCSLEITHLELNDARLYSCDDGTLNSSVSLQVLEVTEGPTSAEDTMELQCFLNIFIGYVACHNSTGIRIEWRNEDGTPIKGNRFTYENPSACFSKLIMKKKLTDHYRKWKCQLSQSGVVKAAISYTTAVKDGMEEVFTAVGESVSLKCSNTSSLGLGGNTQWAMCEKQPAHDISPDNFQAKVKKDSTLVISKVSAAHAGDYLCSESTGQQRALRKYRLHTLDVTAESGTGGDNLTLTCVLTCATECEKDFNLTFSGGVQKGWQSGLMNVNNTFIKKLFLSDWSHEISCSVHREGALMASKKWHSVSSLQSPAWIVLPLGLLMCAAAAGLYMYMKRKHNTDAVNEQSSIAMTHVYEVIQDEELQQQRHFKREAAAMTDSFYDLLQAVNYNETTSSALYLS
ncbi:uncharacterized protein LOC129349682 isoform X2 [Amphiprion ocellaris]|uniref:uncharacterized protein LOC129349682 isoform X2 n=1 Tax=Amphiprion ocellaris TaxID=80972 RepID=UPI0024112829|nr:uncharacterized protein LOC129349682 isoform X2 [Amphiprion ocellaris]